MKYLDSSLRLIVVSCLIINSADSQLEDNQDEESYQLPEVFNFEHFKTTFSKHYATSTEEQVRQSIFLARAFEAFVSSISYKYGKTSYYLSVNQMSDWTQADVDQSKVNIDWMIEDFAALAIEPPKEATTTKSDVFVTTEDIKRKLVEIEQHKDEPGNREIAKELLSLTTTTTTNKKLRKREVSNTTYGPHSFNSSDDFLDVILRDAVGGSIVSKNKQTSEEDPLVDEWNKLDSSKIRLPNVDHRKSNCLLQPRNQDKCGSCYAFATIALYEWKYCKETGDIVAFSEQFMVDCGQRTELSGCHGGSIARSVEFVDEFGLELSANYPYRSKADQCPYEPEIDTKKMGYLKIGKPKGRLVKIAFIHEFIERTPIIVGVRMNDQFRQYGGGIHDNIGCKSSDSFEGHAMLLVGSGSQNGKEYYLMKNSHSVAWGELGYYKLSKEAFYNCSVYPFGVIDEGSFERINLKSLRKDYQYEPIRRRYYEYLM